MTTIMLHVAAYSSLDDARVDWDDTVAEQSGWAIGLLDAVLVEARDGTICTVHRFWSDGVARGALAGAVVGLLCPAALVCGALAGGVGDQTIKALSRGVDRGVIQRLGRALDRAPFSTVTVEESRDHRASTTAHWPRSVKSSAADVTLTVEQLDAAVFADDML